jgi:hypothetical protein
MLAKGIFVLESLVGISFFPYLLVFLLTVFKKKIQTWNQYLYFDIRIVFAEIREIFVFQNIQVSSLPPIRKCTIPYKM